MLEYSYTKLNDNSPIPIVRVSINNLRNNKYFQHDAILDTGSDVTLVSISIISKLEPPRIGRVKIKPKGLGGKEIGIAPHRINLGFTESEVIKVKVWSCVDRDLEEFIILGRNFLNRYKITFDGINNKFIIY